jgi:hypothetical protein
MAHADAGTLGGVRVAGARDIAPGPSADYSSNESEITLTYHGNEVDEISGIHHITATEWKSLSII